MWEVTGLGTAYQQHTPRRAQYVAPGMNDGTNMGAPPQAAASEMAVLGAILRVATVDTAQAAHLLDRAPNPGDYYLPHHQLLATHLRAIAGNGMALDPAGVLTHLQLAGDLKPHVLDGPYLDKLLDHDCPPSSVDWHTDIIARHARRRRVQRAVKRAAQLLDGPDLDRALDDLIDAADLLDTAVRDELHGGHTTALTVETIDELLAGDDTDDYDWIIPGLLERQDRLILTGGEGKGKSTLLRQLAIQTAAGIHPFTGELMPPIRVLYVDCENSRRQVRRKTRAMRAQAGARLDPDRLRMSIRVEGLDLTQTQDVAWLERHVAATRPDLLITGPIYKLANGDPTEEKSAKPVAMALDRIRAHHRCAVALEAHAPKALGGSRKRAHEPYGWSGWLRWPEFGLWLGDDGDLEHWRGMRDERDWPTLLQRGGAWPWTVAASENAARWQRIRQVILDAGQRLTDRQLSQATGIPRSTVQRVLGEYAQQYEALTWRFDSDDNDQ